MGVYEGSLSGSQNKSEGQVRLPTTPKKDLNLVTSRKLALQALGALPKKFEERYLLPYVLQLRRMLALACGDPVREVRQVARLARGNWAKVS